MIEKQIQKVELNQIIENQIPSFTLTEDNTGFVQFLKQYYISQEFQGASVDISENIPEYKNVDIFNTEDLISSTTLTIAIDEFEDEIVVTSTLGWPQRYGLLKIDDEIITYTSKTTTKFLGCIRGFSGIDSYNRKNETTSLVFSTSTSASHKKESKVTNLSNLFLKELLFKTKTTFAPGFENYNLADGLDQTIFLKKISDFYKSKGTDDAFKLLFKVLYNKNVDVIKPQDYLIRPSDAEYLTEQSLLVEFIEGEDLKELETLSIIQEKDSNINIFDASASISSVETLRFENTTLYKLLLDSATIEGTFNVSGRTKSIEPVSKNATVINVDSTIGFPSSGSFDYFDSFGDKITVKYTSKTVNQFLGCSDVLYSIPEKTTLNYGSYAFIDNPFTGVRTKVKLLKVINDIEKFDTNYYSTSDYVTIKSFGEYYDNSPNLSTWIFNPKTIHDISSISKQSNSYKFLLPEEHNFLIGDTLELYDSITSTFVNKFTVTQINSNFEFLGNFGEFSLDVTKKYFIKRVIHKINSDIYSQLTSYIGNVSNVYVDDSNLYIASNSLPVYAKNNTKISVSKNTITFTASTDGVLKSDVSHKFYSGEKVYAKFSKTTSLSGSYFVKVIDTTSIYLSKSSADIFSKKYIEISESQSCEVTLNNVYLKDLSAQPILRKLPKTPKKSSINKETTPDNGIGILVNGVELLSYKSKDYINYGPLESIKILNSGKKYDVINPPKIIVKDTFSGVGTGAVLSPYLSGGLFRIDILDPGFDLIETPEIFISGGNGTGAKAVAKIKPVEYSISCRASVGVNTSTDIISFETNHKFKNGEEILYLNNGNAAIGVGTTTLINGSKYYVNVVSNSSIKLYNTKNDSLTNVNSINFNSIGDGTHLFQSSVNKNVLSSVVVESTGFGYKNYPRTISTVGINTFNSTISFKNHLFTTGEKVVYSTTGTSISGLTTASTYYAIKVNENEFRLSSTQQNAIENKFISLTSSGSGLHTFNYEPISVTITAKNGFGTSTYNPSVRPIFLGTIDDIKIISLGKNYGTQEIVNFEANPLVTIDDPISAELKPIIVNGKIKEVIIDNQGSGYQSPPNIRVAGDGNGAKLIAVLNQSGGISSVIIENPGNGYTSKNTSIVPEVFGSSLVVEAKIKKWTFDRNKKFESYFKSDDGFLENSKSLDGKLQFFSTYLPRELRKHLYTLNTNGTKFYDSTDFDNDTSTTKRHSPIIGWSYDGCPIYGQYGYSTPTGGTIKKLVSGYTKISNRNDGPSSSIYPIGTFIEDYEYTASGDLDEFNGRYCITPDYPNGVYAYFATNLEFPYIIANNFAFEPEVSSLTPFASELNQNIDYEKLKLKRYTRPYRISNSHSRYEYFNSPKDVLKFPVKISKVSFGKIESINVLTSGENYKTGDLVINKVDNNEIGEINSIFKDNLVSIATTSLEYSSSPIFYNDLTSEIEVFLNTENQINNLDVISITKTSNNSFDNLLGFKQVGVSSLSYTLSIGIGTTVSSGIVTTLFLNNVNNLSPNNILQIKNEKLLVLNTYKEYNSVRVEREYNSPGLGLSYTSGEIVQSLPISFKVISGINTNTKTIVNKQTYFSPLNSVGVSSVGIGSTVMIFTGIGFTAKELKPKSIYIPNHGYKTGQKLVYFNGGGTSLGVSTNGSNIFSLSDNSFVYVAKYTNDEIGISTTPVGLGTTGFIGIGTDLNILFFNTIGTGEKHSFKTTFSEITVDVKKINSTITTRDPYTNVKTIDLVVLPNQTTYLKLLYDQSTRRLVFNPKTVDSVDTLVNIITISNHNYNTGDKVLYKTTGTAIGGLNNNSFYYVIVYNNSKFKLVEYFLDSFNPDFSEVNITSSGTGTHTFYLINPKLNVYKGNKIVFDTSDSSLSDSISGNKQSSFSFDIYRDPKFTEKLISPSIVKTGSIGIGSTSTESNLTIITNNIEENILYYGLLPINTNTIDTSKKNIIFDFDGNENFKINILDSLYNGTYDITGITTTSFSINLQRVPEQNNYSSTNSTIKYITFDKQTSGKINSVKVTSSRTFEYPLTNTFIESSEGKGAVVSVNSGNIGNIDDISSLAVTSELPSDPTLVPTVNFPRILRVEELSSLAFVGIISGGRKYTVPPKLVVLDTSNDTIVSDIELQASLLGTSVNSVKIISNTKSLYDITPKIIPTNNSNGVGISSISYNDISKRVLVSIAASFSVASDYPFRIGQKVFVENIGVTSTTDKGFNSSDYSYSTFEVVGVNTNLGGAKPTVTYQIPLWASNANIGVLTCKTARIIPEEELCSFVATTKVNSFNSEEEINAVGKTGKVVSWDLNLKLLKVNSFDNFSVGDIVFGRTSGTRAKIIENIHYDSDFITGPLTKSFSFFNKENGKISESFQRFEDSDYNQLFSYSLKSEIPFDTWKNPVIGLAHISGYKPFSDLQIISTGIGTTTSKTVNYNDVQSKVEVFNQISFNCRNDYNQAFESTILENGKNYSDKILFKSAVLTDFIQSRTNRALILDDISSKFSSVPRSEKFAYISRFNNPSDGLIKNFIFVRDKNTTDDKCLYQFVFVNDGPNYEQLTYSSNWTRYDLGYFEVLRTKFDEMSIQFYPFNYELNDYNVTNLSISLLNTSKTGITTQSLGTIGTIEVAPRVTIASTTTPSQTQIIGFSTTKYTSSKVITLVQSTTGLLQSNELTLLQNGDEVILSEYGEITSNNDDYGSSGLGTYSAEISGGNVVLNFTPISGVGVTVISQFTSISSNTGIGTTFIGSSYIDSNYISIASTSSPVAVAICGFSSSVYDAAYIISEVRDISTNSYQLSELVLVGNTVDTNLVEYNVTNIGNNLGSYSSRTSGSNYELTFTPVSGTSVEIRTIKYVVKSETRVGITTFINSEIKTQSSEYLGTVNSVVNSFNITSNSYPVFYKQFEGSSSSVVDITNNVINLSSHFFSNGEKLTYETLGSPIGIATTTITGIGTTDKLPSEVYVIKVDENKFRLAASASDALSTSNKPLILSSVGIGTSHSFNPEKQNTKLLITIDNVVQSPLVETNVAYSTTEFVSNTTSLIKITGVNNISSGDILKLDDEYLKVTNVGLGTTNGVTVRRGFFNTGITSHTIGSTVRKYNGSYIVIKNTLYFVDPPYGRVGVSSDQYSTFAGRVFLRTGRPGSATTAYADNYVFDDISNSFTGIGKTFTLTSSYKNITGISTNNGIVLINNIPQVGNVDQNYFLEEVGGTSTNIIFNGTSSVQSYDINVTDIPRSGVINEFITNNGFGLQPLIGAGATAIVSVSGTITSVSIGNSGSGYRSGIQTNINVRAIDPSTGITTIIGKANSLSGFVTSITLTNPGSGYTSSNPPLIEIDKPLIYQDLPLLGGSGTGAKVSIVVGQGSSVIDFNITNFGYGYNDGDFLYLDTGGSTGIQTVSSAGIGFTSFSITVDSIYKDKFAGWTFGELQTLDNLTPLVDGVRTSFLLTRNGEVIDLRTNNKSLINLSANLIVLRNGIVQVPGKSYEFTGGSKLTFTEAPLLGDKIQVLFYRGSEFDSSLVDIEPSIKPGDFVTLDDSQYQQEPRIVKQLLASDQIETNYYSGPGIVTDINYGRVLKWCKQKDDLILDGNQISKSREINNSRLFPATNIIKSVSSGSTEIFVQSLVPLFNEFDDISTDNLDIVIINDSVGIGTSEIATYQKLENCKVSGDFGIISGVTTAVVGIASTALVFDFVIPSNSALRNSTIFTSPITISGIATNYYFTVYDSNIGNGVVSIANTGSTVGIGTSFIDNVYQVYSTQIITDNAFGIGNTSILRVTSLVNSYSGIATGTNNFFGYYSWGKIHDYVNTINNSYNVNNQNGLTGISTSSSILRLKQIRTPY